MKRLVKARTNPRLALSKSGVCSPPPHLPTSLRADARPTPEIRYSNSRSRAYFYSNNTKESVWDRPAGLNDEAILQLKGAELLNASPPGKVRASHLLVKHKDSRRPGSWKTAVITRTKEDAVETLKGYQQTLLAAPDLQKAFAELAKIESDCSSARDGGDLGEWSF